MITPEHVRLMARYNAWQNESVYREADMLGDAARRSARGAFFSSIHATLSHLAWGDRLWMHRFSGTEKPVGGIKESGSLYPDWIELKAARRDLDEVINNWAAGVRTDWLAAEKTWFSGAIGRDVTRAHWIQVTHFFNHQTHHRGQIHAMVTAAGGTPDDTDLVFMPGLDEA